MVIVNFGHPLTEAQCGQIAAATGRPVERVAAVTDTQFDLAGPFDGPVRDLADRAGLSPVEWQTLELVVNPPTHAAIACAVLAELHGRAGYFPSVLVWRAATEAATTTFAVVNVANLQRIRNASRPSRA